MFLSLPLWLKATSWGLLSGSALVIGASIGYFFKVPRRVLAFVMAFGSGVLISALAFDLMDEAFKVGGALPTAIGFLAGAALFSVANYLLNGRGGKHRKRSGDLQAKEESSPGSGTAIALGALIDGIPESIVIGVSMIEGGGVSTAAVIAIFLSNLPEGMSSAAGMKEGGRSRTYIFCVWGAIAIVSGLGAFAGYSVFSGFPQVVIAATIAIAAGAILNMLSNTMIPEAFEEGHDMVGFVTVLGFLTAFIVTKMEG
jgi:ZIP family zinc transporter